MKNDIENLERENKSVNRCLSSDNANSIELPKPERTNMEYFNGDEDKEDVGKNYPNSENKMSENKN